MHDDPDKAPSPGDWTGTPQQLLEREDLDREQKIRLLREWELDLRERMVAEDENMAATEPATVTLDDVLEALQRLDATPSGHPVPSTHG